MASMCGINKSFLLLAFVLLLVSLPSVHLSSLEDIVLDVDPSSGLDRIPKYTPTTFNITLRYNGSDPATFAATNDVYIVTISLSNVYTATVMNLTTVFTTQDVVAEVAKPVDVVGHVIGYVLLTFRLHTAAEDPDHSEGVVLRDQYMISVVNVSNIWDNVFTLVMAILTMVNTVNMGCCLDLGLVKQTLLKPIGPIVGFVSQFTFMPLFSFGMAWAFLDTNLLRLGLFVMGSCPGGAASNVWNILLDGDVNLSITMTFISTVAALGMMPLWIWLLGHNFLDGQSVVRIPYTDMIISLVTLTVPLAIGLLIRRWRKSVADFLANKFIKPFSFAITFFTFGLGFYSLSHIFVLLTWQLLVAGLSIAVAGFLFGAAFAWVARLGRAQIIAISLETALQNGTIAYVLLKISMPAPFCDLAALPPIAQILMTATILFGFLGIWKLYQCCFGKKKNTKGEKDAQISSSEPEVGKPLMTPLPEIATRRDQVYYGGEVPEEFLWVKRASLIVPNSPTRDSRTNQ